MATAWGLVVTGAVDGFEIRFEIRFEVHGRAVHPPSLDEPCPTVMLLGSESHVAVLALRVGVSRKMSTEAANRSATKRRQLGPRIVAAAAGAFFFVSGLWAMVAPEAFFEAAATFEPFNAHLIRDVGAFMLGLGAVLILAAERPTVEALAVALCGVGIGAAAHTVSHVVDRDHGGTPAVDIPVWGILSLVLLWAGVARWRHTRTGVG